MRVIEQISEAEMVAAFLQAELLSQRFGKKIRAALDRLGYDEQIVIAPNTSDLQENGIRAQLLEFRGYPKRDKELFSLFPHDVSWYRVEMPLAELLQARYIDWDYWNELTAGDRLISTGVRSLSATGPDRWNLRDTVLLMAQAFEAGESLGDVILVGQSFDSPKVILEGHARLTALGMANNALSLPRVIVGLSPNIQGWPLFGKP